jgi:MFS family permease
MSSRQMQRYVIFAQGLLMSLCAGTLYAYGTITSDLQKEMGWEASDVNLVYSIGSFGQYMGFIPGAVFDKLGSRAICLYSMLAGGGYLLIWLQVSTHFSHSPMLMGLFLAFSGTGSLGLYYGGLLVSTKNFDVKHNGKIVGTLAAGFGISAKIFTLIYEAVDNDLKKYLLVVAIVLLSVATLSIAIIRVIPPEQVGGLLPTDYKTVSSESGFDESLNASLLEENMADAVPVWGDSEKPLDGAGTVSATAAEDALLTTKLSLAPEDLQSGCATFKQPEYICMMLVFSFSLGAGVMIIGELGQLAEANGFGADKVALVGMVSYLNCGGRLATGALSDLLAKWINGPMWIVIGCVAMLLGHAALLAWQTSHLFIATSIIGLAYGSLFAALPAYTRVRFGSKNFGVNFGVATFALSVGNLVLSTISGALIDSATPEGAPGNECQGEACFKSTLYMSIGAAVCGLLAAIAIVLFARQHAKALRFMAREMFDQQRVE